MPDMPGQNLQQLLRFLMSKTKGDDTGAILPGNYPGVFPVDQPSPLESAYTKFNPGAGADVANVGYGLPQLISGIEQGKIGGDALTQLAQLLTAHIRNQPRGPENQRLETPSLLDQFSLSMKR